MQGLWASCQCLLTRWQPGRGVGGCSSLGVGGSRVSPRLVSQGRRGKPSVFQPLQPSLERILPPPKRQRVFPFQAKLDNGASSWTSKLPLACPVLFWIDNLSASYCTKYSIGIVSLFLTAAFEVGFFFFFWFHYTAYGILVPSWWGTEPRPLTVKAKSHNHWTVREFPWSRFFYYSHFLDEKTEAQPGLFTQSHITSIWQSSHLN